MQFTNTSISGKTSLTVVAEGALVQSGATFPMGLESKNKALTGANQAYAMVGAGITEDVVVSLAEGTFTGGGTGTVASGAGKDSTGADIDLSKVHVFHIRNTGSTPMSVTFDTWTGSGGPSDGAEIPLPAGGELQFIFPAGELITDAQVTLNYTSGVAAFELLVVGTK